jgi:virginiamycin B lyase
MKPCRILLACTLGSLCLLASEGGAQVVTEFIAGITPGAFPAGITAGPDDSLWFTEAGRNGIGKITTAGMVTEYGYGISTSSLSGITAGPDGNLWFTEFSGSRIGKITTAGVVTEYSIGIGTAPQGITSDPDGNLWFTERLGNRIGKITTTGTVTEYSSGYTGNVQLFEITAGPDGNLWFTGGTGPSIANITTAGVVTKYSSGIGANGITAGPTATYGSPNTSATGLERSRRPDSAPR